MNILSWFIKFSFFKLQQYAEQTPGEDQYAINKFGESFEVVPRTLAENAGQNATSVVATLYAKHMEGNINFGVDIEVNIRIVYPFLLVLDLGEKLSIFIGP